jgi:hypothetical protein
LASGVGDGSVETPPGRHRISFGWQAIPMFEHGGDPSARVRHTTQVSVHWPQPGRELCTGSSNLGAIVPAALPLGSGGPWPLSAQARAVLNRTNTAVMSAREIMACSFGGFADRRGTRVLHDLVTTIFSSKRRRCDEDHGK